MMQVVAWSALQVGPQLADGSFAIVFEGVYKGVEVAIKKWRVQEVNARELELFKREVEANAYA